MAKRPIFLKACCFILLVSLYFTIVLNTSFWQMIFERFTYTGFSSIMFAISLPVFIFSMLYLLFNLIVLPKVGRFLVILLLLCSSVACYATFKLGITINAGMIQNFAETNRREATDLITTRALIYVFLTGIVPAILVALTKISYEPFKKELKTRLFLCACAILCVAVLAPFTYKDYVSFGRNNPNIRRQVNPFNYIFAINKYYKKIHNSNQKFVVLDEAPVLEKQSQKPRLLVLIVGETARAENFSLNGYEKETNPLLKNQDIINFSDVTSCGTATAVSLPCMFSASSRQEFKPKYANNTENLMDIIKKAGYDVFWHDNDDGCKGVCARVSHLDAKKGNIAPWCFGDYCQDDILLNGLKERILATKENTVIVLHTMGSHGPTYYKRYPEAFKRFTPTCETKDLERCTKEEILNTYNNTLVYTDYIISSVIDILKEATELETAMIYLSDHGESLGEKNIYLHGIPYALAPDVQKKVPMIFWLSEEIKHVLNIDTSALKEKALAKAYSHDNYYHTVLGLLEIKSTTYQKALDILNEKSE